MISLKTGLFFGASPQCNRSNTEKLAANSNAGMETANMAQKHLKLA